MIGFMVVTLSLIADGGEQLPIATFDTYAECSAVLPNMIYDANCADEMRTSPRPRPKPTERTE